MSVRLQRLLAVLLVVLAGALAYSPALDNGFINYDDQQFIFDNPWVSGGLTRDSVWWALTADAIGDSEYTDYWQPATLISRLVDGTLFGLNPMGHHFTSILIHIVNAVLVLLLLAAATGRLWPSAVVALVFATHPLHVSSVVWATGRKDVLSVLFSLVTLAIFARFAAVCREHLDLPRGERSGGRVVRWYLLLVAGYALCLMSKPMTLPLPLVLLLVAVWPIPRARRPGLGRLALCLAPLLLLSAGAVFLYSRVGVVSSEFGRIDVQQLSGLAARVITSLAAYPVRLLYPAGLQHFYAVHPDQVAAGKVAASFLLLGAVSVVAAVWARRRPSLVVGWSWYVVSILPASTAFLTSAAADRFSYFPMIGVTVMLVWAVCETAGRRLLVLRAAAAAGAVCALILATRAECRHWKDSRTLFSHLLELDPNHDTAHANLGAALLAAGAYPQALESFQAALAVRPDLAAYSIDVGAALERLGRLDDALRAFSEGVRLDPDDYRGHLGLGRALWGLGRLDEARAMYRESIRLNPRFGPAHYNLGLILGQQEQYEEALAQFREALRLNPKNDEARSRIAAILERQRR